jgi:hypothetical protein
MTSPLFRADVKLGLGLIATIEIVEHDPAPPPPTGAEWAREIDWPIAELRLSLPSCETGTPLASELQCDLFVVGERLSDHWGSGCHDSNYRPIAGPRTKTTTSTAEYLDDAVTALRGRAESDLAPLIAHVAKRAARLARRETALAAGRAGRAKSDERPIEIDSERKAALDPTTDDSSQRFALLEIDHAPAPARNRRRKVA